MQYWSDSVRYLAAILVILNPIGAVPVFLGVTAGQSCRDGTRPGEPPP